MIRSSNNYGRNNSPRFAPLRRAPTAVVDLHQPTGPARFLLDVRDDADGFSGVGLATGRPRMPLQASQTDHVLYPPRSAD